MAICYVSVAEDKTGQNADDFIKYLCKEKLESKGKMNQLEVALSNPQLHHRTRRGHSSPTNDSTLQPQMTIDWMFLQINENKRLVSNVLS